MAILKTSEFCRIFIKPILFCNITDASGAQIAHLTNCFLPNNFFIKNVESYSTLKANNVDCKPHINVKFFSACALPFANFRRAQFKPWKDIQLSKLLKSFRPTMKMAVQIKIHVINVETLHDKFYGLTIAHPKFLKNRQSLFDKVYLKNIHETRNNSILITLHVLAETETTNNNPLQIFN